MLDVEFGGRVWLVPPWYVVARHRGRKVRLAWAELAMRIAKRPRMVSLAKVFGPFAEGSGVTWTVHKGLVGQLTFEGLLFDVLQHDRYWPDDLNRMTERQWNQLSAERRGGRTLHEARELKRLYGTAIGVPLIDPESLARLGCMTIHSASSRALNESEVERAVELLLTNVTELSRQIVSKTGLGNQL